MKILGISGSLRATSSNTALIRAAALLCPASVQVTIYDDIASLPSFSPDLDVEPLPDAVKDLRSRIASASALMISSPEYAHGMPGSLKNLLDWLVSALEALEKPVLLFSASPGGAQYAHAQLTEVLRTMNLNLVDGGAHVFARARLDVSGEVSDPAMLAKLEEAVSRLLARVG